MRRLLLGILLFSTAMAYCQQTILWKISKGSNDPVSYLLGTYHFFGNTFVDSYPVIKERLAASSVLITETILDKAEVLNYFNARPSSDTLSHILSEKDISYIKSFLKAHDLAKLTPGEIFATLSANYPRFKCIPNSENDSLVFDAYLQKMARESGKQIIALDERQQDMFRQLTAQYDWKFFKKNIDNLLKLYRNDKPDAGRCAPVLKYMNLEIDYNFTAACPTSAANDTRNSKWMQVIPEMLNKSSCFIAVGITHLTASCGLVMQLKKLGWTVEPVMMK
jgi:uncharacterized protein